MTNTLPLLLISSDMDARHSIITHVQKLKLFSIDTAIDSNEAIRKLRENDYRFIISDINIGDVDAWCLSSLIRSDIYVCDRKTPIVLLTDTYSERIAEATAKSFGINAVLAKSESSQVNEILADALSLSLPINDKLKCLVIASDPVIHSQFVELVDNRFLIERVFTAKDGLSMVRQKQYDFAIIDTHLDNEAAMPLMQTINNEYPNFPLVMFVPRGDLKLAENYMLNGASDFIYTPFNPQRVINICERAARRNDFKISNNQFANKVNQLKSSEHRYKELSAAHSQLLSTISSVVLEINTGGEINFLNKAWSQITGFGIEPSLNRNILEFIEFDEFGGSKFTQKLADMLSQHISYCCEEVRLKTTSGASVWVEFTCLPLIKNEAFVGLAATIENIDDRKKAEEKLQHLALHDTLTGLYNRYYFDTELNRLTLLASRGNESHTLLYIDLDHFKIINDTEGHQMGDLVLKEVSRILRKRLRSSDILCRVGGDEFVILLPETTMSAALEIGNQICHQIADAHFQFGTNSYKVSASIGLSEIDGNATAPEYLRQADIALYVAKNKGRNRCHCYTDQDLESRQQHDSMKWAQRLQEAVVNDNIILHYQPVWDIKRNQVAYYEALVRLRINTQIIYPNDFIPALERTEDINMLDHQVISKAIKTISDHPELIKVAINLSAQAFSDDALLPLIKNKLKEYKVDGNKIIFELTESASLTNVSGTRRMIEQLTLLGCQFSIDDFGTGFSTFAYLKELPASSVKIDGSFVKDMNDNESDKVLVTAITNVARALGKQSVAEFVENAEILEELEAIGVEYAQGFYISKPLEVDDIKTFSFSR